MNETVDAVQVYKDPEVGDGLDAACYDVVDIQFAETFFLRFTLDLLTFLVFSFEDNFLGKDRSAALCVVIDDDTADFVAYEASRSLT